MTVATRTRPRILLADDHRVLLDSLVASLEPHYEIVAQVETLASLREAIERTAPDVVLLDLLFGGESALPLLRGLLADPTIRARFVVLSGAENPTLVASTTTSGIMAFVPKEVGVEELRRAIDAALVGERDVPVPSQGRDVPGSRVSALRIGGVTLRRRQVEVVFLLMIGGERTEVARKLHLGTKSVDYHLGQLRKRLGLESSRQVIAWATGYGDELSKAFATIRAARERQPRRPESAA